VAAASICAFDIDFHLTCCNVSSPCPYQGNKSNTWDEYDFTLTSNKLEYSNGGATKGFVDFERKGDVTVAVNEVKKKKMRAAKKYCFTMVVDHGTKTELKLASSSEDDMKRWVTAITTFAKQEALIIKKGFLQKKGQKRKNFLERFFELTRTKLIYYVEEGGKPKGELVFVDGKVMVEYSDQFGNETQGGEAKPMKKRTSLVTKRRSWCFTISSGKRELIVAAPSEETMFDWANAIKQAVDPRASAVTRRSMNVPADTDMTPELAMEAKSVNIYESQELPQDDSAISNPLSATSNPLHVEESNGRIQQRLSMETAKPETTRRLSAFERLNNDEKARRLSAFTGPPEGLDTAETAQLYALHAVCMVLLAMLPALAFLTIFSDITYRSNTPDSEFRLGHGAEIHAYLVSQSGLTVLIAGGTFLLFLVLYLLDVSYWEGAWVKVKHTFFIIGGIGIILVSLLCSNWLPAAPMGVFCILICGYTGLASSAIFPGMKRADFFIGLSHVLLAIGCVMLSVWCSSTFIDGGQGMWSQTLEQGLRLRLRNGLDPDSFYCRPTPPANCMPVPAGCADDDSVTCTEDCKQQGCTAAYLIWVGPLLGTVACWVAAAFSRVLGKALARNTSFGSARIVIGSVLAIGFGMWCAASVSATSSTVSQTILGLTMIGAIILGVMVSSAIGWNSLKSSINHNPLVVKLAEVCSADFIKALIVLACWFPFLCYLMLSALNQCIRVHLGWHPAGSLHREARTKSGDLSLPDPDALDDIDTPVAKSKHSLSRFGSAVDSFTHIQWLTEVANNQLRAVHNWRWTSVLSYVMCWGIFFISVNVGITKIVTIFLSWLNTDLLAPLPLGVVIAIFYAIGLFMFLLPPVPGVPVYLAGGVILVKKFEDDGTSFLMSLVFTSLICTMIKLNAVAMQQKLFGERLGNRVWIRSLVGVNSLSIRAIKLILEKPGLSGPKIAILCGGPDWPTSVLTGILGLKLSQMLIGTLPIFFLIAPCVCAGGFQLKKGESEVYASLANVAILSATVAQMTALLAAMYYIEEMADKKSDYIQSLPKDKEVEEVDHKNRKKAELKHSLTDWKDNTFPLSIRIVLFAGGAAMAMSVYTVQLLGTKCFRAFEVTSTIACPTEYTMDTAPEDSPCLDGNVFNIILPYGYYCLGLFTVGCICLWVYGKWASKRVAAKMAELNATFQGGAKLVAKASMFIDVAKAGTENKGAAAIEQAGSSALEATQHLTTSKKLEHAV
jgi:hypothetical protein